MPEEFSKIAEAQKAKLDKITSDFKSSMKELDNDLEKQFLKFDRETEAARVISRDALYKMVLLETSIVAFSVTLLSVASLRINPDLGSLKISWIIFLGSIIFWLLSLFIESRAKFTISWRNLQVSEYDKKDYSWTDHLKVMGVALYSLFVSPRNLIFCTWRKNTDEYKKYVHNMNAKVIGLVADILKVPLFFEGLSLILFVAGLYYFIKTFL